MGKSSRRDREQRKNRKRDVRREKGSRRHPEASATEGSWMKSVNWPRRGLKNSGDIRKQSGLFKDGADTYFARGELAREISAECYGVSVGIPRLYLLSILYKHGVVDSVSLCGGEG